jgi:hypothetical protein
MYNGGENNADDPFSEAHIHKDLFPQHPPALTLKPT